MADNNLSGFDLTNRLLAEREAPKPDTIDSGSGMYEIPPIIMEIDKNKNEHPFIEKKARADQLAIQKHVKSFSKVFLIWRSWEYCDRCQSAISLGEISLPEEGDYTCKHTQADEYKKVMDSCLSGQGCIMMKESFNTKRGDRLTHLEWVEGSPEKIAEEQAKMMQKKDPVYPPNPEKVFSDI